MYTGENRPRKPEQKFDAALGTIFIISKCFQRSKQKLHMDFSHELGMLKIIIKNICACTESTVLIV
jgi:hypothetical protein